MIKKFYCSCGKEKSRRAKTCKKCYSKILEISMIGKGNHFFGRKHSESTKQKIALANTNPSKETRIKISNAKKGKPSWMKGKRHTLETKKKMSELKKGIRPPQFHYIFSEETRKKISRANKGKSPWIKGKKHTLYSREKMSKSHRGKPSSMKGHENPWTRTRNLENNPLKNPQTKEKALKAIRQTWNTPEMKEYARLRRMKQKLPSKMTSIEILIKNVLDKNKIVYEMHKSILNITQPDFYIEPNLCIYCDGDYWHSLPKAIIRDNNINTELQKNGYKVLRFPEIFIKSNINLCEDIILNSVSLTIKNKENGKEHKGIYNF